VGYSSGEVYWSERIYTILGLSPESFKPGYLAQVALIHPDDLDTFEHAIQDHLQSGKPYHLRVRYRTATAVTFMFWLKAHAARCGGTSVTYDRLVL
jgi:PAS domain-containing protein